VFKGLSQLTTVNKGKGYWYRWCVWSFSILWFIIWGFPSFRLHTVGY